MRSHLMLAATGLVAAASLSTFTAAAAEPAPVKVLMQRQFGHVLADRMDHALYTWNREKDHKIHCTGACAKIWPPITVEKGTTVAAHVQGLMGTFGTIKRPDGTTQLTWDGRPVYTFHLDTRTKILCNGVQGWFVVKA